MTTALSTTVRQLGNSFGSAWFVRSASNASSSTAAQSAVQAVRDSRQCRQLSSLTSLRHASTTPTRTCPETAIGSQACIRSKPYAACWVAAGQPFGLTGGREHGCMQWQQRRWYPSPIKGQNAPTELATKLLNVKVSMVSPNVVAEPYRGEPPRIPLREYFGMEGWRKLRARFLGHGKSAYTLAKIKRSIKGSTLAGFKAQAGQLYGEVCHALAQGDLPKLRQIVTQAEYGNLKNEVKKRENMGVKRLDWELSQLPTGRSIEVLQGRVIGLDPQDDTKNFAQLTVRIKSRQKFAAYNATGRLLAGDPENDVAVSDIWVLEHGLHTGPGTRWRLAGRINPPAATASEPATKAASAAATAAAAPHRSAAQSAPIAAQGKPGGPAGQAAAAGAKEQAAAKQPLAAAAQQGKAQQQRPLTKAQLKKAKKKAKA